MSKTTIRIPTPLRGFTGGADEVEAEGGTVGEALRAAGHAHPGLLEKVLDGDRVRPFVNVFMGSENIKAHGGLDAELADGAVLSIIPAVAGGHA